MKKTLALFCSLWLLLVTSALADGTNNWPGWTNTPPNWTNSWGSWTNTSGTWSNQWANWTNNASPTWTNHTAWWTNVANWTNASVPGSWTNHHGSVRPPRTDRPDRPGIPADLQDWIAKFEASRAEWLKNQPTGGTTPDRDAILAQIQALRDSWRDQSAQSRQQWLDQVQSMRDHFNDHRDRVLDGSGDGSRGNRDR